MHQKNMIYRKHIIDLANKYGMQPIEIRGIEIAFNTVTRLAHIENINELNETIIEKVGIKNKKRLYIYEDLPQMLKDTAKKALLRYGVRGIGVFYNGAKKDKNLEIFLKSLLKMNIQPSEFCFGGILTYREFKREPMDDKTVEIISYK